MITPSNAIKAGLLFIHFSYRGNRMPIQTPELTRPAEILLRLLGSCFAVRFVALLLPQHKTGNASLFCKGGLDARRACM
jgi:hypothetical protein